MLGKASWTGLVCVVLGCSPGSSPAAPPVPVPASSPAEQTVPEPAPAPVVGEASLVVGGWRTLVDGLEIGLFESPQPSILGDSRIRVVRVDPTQLVVQLHAVNAEGGDSATAREWAARHDLLAAVNPGMFHPDASATGHLRIGETVVTPTVGKDMHVLALSSRDASLPPLQIIDRSCQDLATLQPSYGSMVQSIRMLSCTGDNVWKPSKRIWSHAVYGTDTAGRLLLIHARSPYSTHDFIEILRALPLDLDRLTYGEGGPEAQLFVGAGGFEGEWYGSYETGFYEHDGNTRAWPVPNILGVRAR